MISKTIPHLIGISLLLIPLEGIWASEYILTEAWLLENPQVQKQQEYSEIPTQNTPWFQIPNVWKLKPTYDISHRIYPKLQDYKLSCEIAALEIVLRYLGYTTSEDEMIKKLPIYNRPYDTLSGIWGDPDKEFVGYLTGSQRWQTGYGVYEFPIMNIALWYWFDGYSINSISSRSSFDEIQKLSDILGELEAWRWIILWWDWCTREWYEDGIWALNESWLKYIPISGKNRCNRDELFRVMYWNTPEWKTIRGISGEHAFVLLGYIGTKSDPTHIIVWDTDTGRHIYPVDEWMRKWRLLDHRSVIIKK
jgi:hypothetical protein